MRPRDPDTHDLLPPPHKRLGIEVGRYHEAALFAMEADPRSPALPVKRKLMMIDRAVDHVIDGDKPPEWVFRSDDTRPDNHFLRDLWRLAVAACARVKREGGPCA